MIPTLHITFNPEQPLTVPVNYQHLLQAFVYSILPQDKAIAIHDEGFRRDKRVYRPLCFSKLIGLNKYDKNTKKLTFQNKVYLAVSSTIPEIIEATLNSLMLADNLTIHGQKVYVDQIHYDKNKVTTDTLLVKAISPITVYSTFTKRNGSKITHYFSPYDLVFEHLIEENFARKFEALSGRSLENVKELLSVKPVKVDKRNKIITNYKETWIIGWTGVYELKAKSEYLSFILDAGLAGKNASGFGMVIPFDKTLPKRN